MSKKKILLLSDDLRMASGIATMSKALVMGTVDKYDWFQVGAAIKHPDKGKILDVSADIAKQTGVEDASVKILPWTGYGNADLVRQLINTEKPDAILHFTDPRYWTWLFQIENEVRTKVPIIYLNIWDDYPAPMYNKEYYESCDLLMGISKQTVNINKLVLGDKAKNKLIKYVENFQSSQEVYYIVSKKNYNYDYENIKQFTILNLDDDCELICRSY